MDNQASKFEGRVLPLIGWSICCFLVTSLTLGIAFPWGICMLLSFFINNSTIEGRKLKFNGKGIGLFGTWIKCFLLTLITFGIYGFWVPIVIAKWVVKNTSFES
ncbi:MAG: YjgN family protein [Treponema sp.]|nr:YjgN family protein [Treponema sp.]